MGAYLLPLLNKSSRHSLITPLSAFLHRPIKRYSKSRNGERGVGERAPSTAEEFQRVAAEKRELQRLAEEKSRQGVINQTSDRLPDAAQVAVSEGPNLETVKEKYKEAAGEVDPNRKGD